MLLGQQSQGQTISQLKDSSRLTIKVIEVVDMTYLTDYTLTIANRYDTLIIKTSCVQNLYFDLDSCITHTVTASKSGYKTINTIWNYPNDSAYVEVEFFMPKENITNEEKKQAHVNTSKLPDWNMDKRGGFQKLTPEKKEFFTARIRIISTSQEWTSHESSD